MKARILYAVLMILIGSSALSLIPQAKATTALLFDNFSGSSLNGAIWSWQQQNFATMSQSQSFLPNLYDESPSLWIGLPRSNTPCCHPYYWDGLTANKTQISAIQSTSNNTLISIAVSARLMNATLNAKGLFNSTIEPAPVSVDAFIGFAQHWTCNGCVNTFPGGPLITLEMFSQSASSILGTPITTKYVADLNGITNSVTQRTVNLDSFGLIDPTAAHVFQVSIKIAGKNSWAAFMVDQMGVFNFTERACSCIIGSGVQQTLYPVISYQGLASSVMPYSLGVQIAYVLVTDYIATPTQLPAGIFPGPTCSTTPNVGSSLNPLGYCTIQPSPGVPPGSLAPGETADLFFQSQAAVLGGGNVYFGGMFLTCLYLIAAILLTATISRNRFLLTFETLFVLTFFTILAIIPWYVMFMAAGFTLTVTFGVIPAGLGGKPGGRNG